MAGFKICVPRRRKGKEEKKRKEKEKGRKQVARRATIAHLRVSMS